MKRFICMGLVLLSSLTFADVLKVRATKQDGELERSLILVTNLKEKVVLDCQSFIQGLRLGEEGEASTLIMDQWECEDLQRRVKSSVRRFQKHCIDIQTDEIHSDYSC